MSGLSKPEKILFDNPNMIYAFGKHNIGTVRESFFASQVSEGHRLNMPTMGDFLVDDGITIEVGGSGKDFSQIKGVKESYLAVDGRETGVGSRIPLWMFGMLY